uniref:CSON000520 protein n=1 Tax=Culicoides sonorensis TaxID=179676 RepID=A0A336MJ24_CULSO
MHDEGWKLNRTNYYQEGWLATGNIRGIVGVTFTTSHCKKNVEYPVRSNFNLRGHRSDVILVKWNEPYQKLASCDSSGIIFVWIKYEGRWSVELINDRNTPVTHFSWSHDGRMALICYQDGFVLVGSVAGQRYWSSMLNLDATITCGIWTPEDDQVYFGTTQGQIIVMDVHGAMVSQVQLCSDVGITAMAWSCEKFKMEEGEDSEPGVTRRQFVLAVSFQNGYIYLLKSFDDVSPCHINTHLNGAMGFLMEWSNSRELLAVAGTAVEDGHSHTLDPNGAILYNNLLKFYTETGMLLYTAKIPNINSPVSALTWGHNDKRIFIATGTVVHIAWVSRRVASLQLLCRLQIQSSLSCEQYLSILPLPVRLKSLISNLFAQTIRCCVPDLKSLREFVSRPPSYSTRLHCTMIRHDDESNQSSGTCYTLYLEFLGGLVPLLKGKRTSKIRPEFVIFDPQIDDSTLQRFANFSAAAFASGVSLSVANDTNSRQTSGTSSSSNNNNNNYSVMKNGTNTDSSDSDLEEGCRSPRMHRKRKGRSKKRNFNDKSPNQTTTTECSDNNDELTYLDTLPEHVKLVEVTSNIWGTKFKIHGLAKTLPANLGQVTYKTSLLHLQPRQMTLVITELRDDFPPGPDPNFNPNIFSEDEEEQQQSPTHKPSHSKSSRYHMSDHQSAPPIAPMSPRPNRFPSRPRSNHHHQQSPLTNNHNSSQRPSIPTLGPLAKAESYDDEEENSNSHNNSSESRNVCQSSSYSRIVSQYSRSSSTSSNQSRVAISPLYCEGSVPQLQSPKNAVAPSDIIFDRPPAGGQTTLMSYSSNTDYTNNVVQVKNALSNHDHSSRTNAHVNPVPLNLNLNLERVEKVRPSTGVIRKQKDLQFIDEEAPPRGIPSSSHTAMKRTPTVVSISPAGIPDSITRSCSVGYLDDVEMVPSDIALSMLRRETPYKRLVLVDKKRQRKKRFNDNMNKRQRLRQAVKSKSLDFGDIIDTPNIRQDLLNLFQQMPKVSESSENDDASSSDHNTISPATQTPSPSAAQQPSNSKFNFKNNLKERFNGYSRTPILNRKERPKSCSICKQISPTVYSKETVCATCRASVCVTSSSTSSTPKYVRKSLHEHHVQSFDLPGTSSNRTCLSSSLAKSNIEKKTNANKKNVEIVTSFTDSPLFSRKYRNSSLTVESSSSSSTANSKNVSSKNYASESSTPILNRRHSKFGSESRHQRRQENCTDTIETELLQVEVTPVEPRSYVSLHTQALTTLENIISRLRDLDDGRLNTPPSSPARQPRSSPASPACSKKGKQRHQSSSPIRQILNSPLLNRRRHKNKQQNESSDDENLTLTQNMCEENSNTSIGNGKHYRDLETFQKAQLRQKAAPFRREFVMHNKAPMWNENSQVYQLDFGGRVTQESAKNFQIEFRGKQVMQFGRIDGNAYTLDFQYPFSALQAFAVALANVTQRLK